MFSKYLTTGSFNEDVMKDVLSFHDLTKIQKYSSLKKYIDTSFYVGSARGTAEISAARKVYLAGDTTKLPPIPDDFAPDFNRLKLRESCREFDGDGKCCGDEIRNALRLCCESRIGVATFDMKTRMGLRPYPSPGGIYPVEIYLFERDSRLDEDFEWKLYHLDPRDFSLRLLKCFKDHSLLASAFTDDELNLLNTAAGAVVTTCIFDRIVSKYGHQGYKFGLMELGFVAQHISTALLLQGVSTLNWASTVDDELGELMGLDHKTELVGHTLWYGSHTSADHNDT